MKPRWSCCLVLFLDGSFEQYYCLIFCRKGFKMKNEVDYTEVNWLLNRNMFLVFLRAVLCSIITSLLSRKYLLGTNQLVFISLFPRKSIIFPNSAKLNSKNSPKIYNKKYCRLARVNWRQIKNINYILSLIHLENSHL